ncbi:MAG: flavodoxin family protein [Acutalibacteraceae bacterium]
MNITIIHGQNHKGSTYHIARMLAEKIGGDITEFMLPRDFDEFCVGCVTCMCKSETLCPHYEKLKPITEAIDKSDVIIFASPVYVLHATGSMKALLDHYAYRWMVHRPEEKMFKKQAVCISTAAGSGMKSTMKDMADSTSFWGIPKTYKLGMAVAETSWDRVKDSKKEKAEKKTTALAKKINRKHGKVKTSLKSKIVFRVMRLMQKNGWNDADVNYWKEKGWLDKARPWKQI